MFDISPDILNLHAARLAWMRHLHPDGPACPDCRARLDGQAAESFLAGRRIHCRTCGKWFTARTGTPWENCTASWQQLYLIAALLRLGLGVSVISNRVGLSDDTVRRYRDKMMEMGL